MSEIEVITAEELRVDDAWWRIYDDSLPTSERESPDTILESIERGVGMAFRSRRADVTTGLATTHLLRNPPSVFLVYIAVSKDDRSEGIGGELFEFSWAESAERLREQGLEPLGLVWEVDPPQDSLSRKRISFFERHEGRVLERTYFQPAVDGKAAVPMKLMFRPAKAGVVTTPETAAALARAMYFEKYQAVNGLDGSQLEEMLSWT